MKTRLQAVLLFSALCFLIFGFAELFNMNKTDFKATTKETTHLNTELICAPNQNNTMSTTIATIVPVVPLSTPSTTITSTTTITMPPTTTTSKTTTQQKKTSTTKKRTTNSNGFSAEDINILEKITYAEAGGEDKRSMMLVARVILNRVKSSSFPNTVRGVVFQKNQFSPIDNGAYNRASPSRTCKEAVNAVLNGWDESQGALFFESCSGSSWHEKNLTFLFQHKKIRFYK